MADGPLSSATVAPPMPPPATSAPVDLRPLTTSELIDRGFALYRAHFAGFLLLALLCQSAPLLSQIATTALQLNPTQTELEQTPIVIVTKVIPLIGLATVAQVFVFCFEVVICFFIADAYLGRIPSVKESIRSFFQMVSSSLWTCFLSWGLICLSALLPVFTLAGVYAYAYFNPPVGLLPLAGILTVGFALLILSVAPVLIILMRLMVTVPALALENASGWSAIRRSASLVRFDPDLGVMYWGEMRLSFLLLPLLIIELMIFFFSSMPLWLHEINEIVRHGTTGAMVPPPDSVLIISQIMTFLAGSLILPLYSIATTLFYYDIRIRREGFDLEFMAGQLKERR